MCLIIQEVIDKHCYHSLPDTAFSRNLIQELQPYQYKNGLHFSAFARCDVSRDSQVENVKPDCNGHFEMGGNVMACRSNKLFKENRIWFPKPDKLLLMDHKNINYYYYHL